VAIPGDLRKEVLHVINFFLSLAPAVQAAIIAAIVSLFTMILGTPLRYAIDRRALRHKLSTEYEYEQRKQLRQLIGRYHGRLLEASERLSFRLWNLYANESEGWLRVNGDFSKPERHYYFATTVYRFLSVLALVRKFESDAIYLDSRIAEDKDLDFVKYLKALHWVCTDVALFKGLQYNTFYATDHFFSDTLRQVCDSCWTSDKFLSIEQFQRQVKRNKGFKPALEFFYGLDSQEDRYRWDRVVAFHLLLLAFINSLGYEMQHTSDDQFADVARKIRHREVSDNLIVWISKLGLSSHKEGKRIVRAITSAGNGA
jgi:hypothetical protein